jgi:hypothetical protein
MSKQLLPLSALLLINQPPVSKKEADSLGSFSVEEIAALGAPLVVG